MTSALRGPANDSTDRLHESDSDKEGAEGGQQKPKILRTLHVIGPISASPAKSYIAISRVKLMGAPRSQAPLSLPLVLLSPLCIFINHKRSPPPPQREKGNERCLRIRNCANSPRRIAHFIFPEEEAQSSLAMFCDAWLSERGHT